MAREEEGRADAVLEDETGMNRCPFFPSTNLGFGISDCKQGLCCSVHGEATGRASETVSQSACIEWCSRPGLGRLAALVVFMPLRHFQLPVESEICFPQVANLLFHHLAPHFFLSGSLIPTAKRTLTGSSHVPGVLAGAYGPLAT